MADGKDDKAPSSGGTRHTSPRSKRKHDDVAGPHGDPDTKRRHVDESPFVQLRSKIPLSPADITPGRIIDILMDDLDSDAATKTVASLTGTSVSGSGSGSASGSASGSESTNGNTRDKLSDDAILDMQLRYRQVVWTMGVITKVDVVNEKTTHLTVHVRQHPHSPVKGIDATSNRLAPANTYYNRGTVYVQDGGAGVNCS